MKERYEDSYSQCERSWIRLHNCGSDRALVILLFNVLNCWRWVLLIESLPDSQLEWLQSWLITDARDQFRLLEVQVWAVLTTYLRILFISTVVSVVVVVWESLVLISIIEASHLNSNWNFLINISLFDVSWGRKRFWFELNLFLNPWMHV